jgi:hypothetical protein
MSHGILESGLPVGALLTSLFPHHSHLPQNGLPPSFNYGLGHHVAIGRPCLNRDSPDQTDIPGNSPLSDTADYDRTFQLRQPPSDSVSYPP